MLPLFLAFADVSPGPAPSSTCAAADPAVTYVGIQLFKKRNAPDHYVISTTLTNIGPQSQTPDITQRVELLRDGAVLAPQVVPALGAGVAYKLAFVVDRPVADRSQPLTITIRYRLESGDAAHNACDRSNDEVTKTFP